MLGWRLFHYGCLPWLLQTGGKLPAANTAPCRGLPLPPALLQSLRNQRPVRLKSRKPAKLRVLWAILYSGDCARLAAHEFAWASVKPHIPNAPTATQLVCACHPHILRYFINPACQLRVLQCGVSSSGALTGIFHIRTRCLWGEACWMEWLQQTITDHFFSKNVQTFGMMFFCNIKLVFCVILHSVVRRYFVNLLELQYKQLSCFWCYFTTFCLWCVDLQRKIITKM